MPPAGSTVAEDGGSLRLLSLWAAPIAVLVGLWLWLAFSSGGYIARQWLPPSLLVGLFGLIVCALTAYPRRPRQLSLALLALFGCYSVWVCLSAIWAASVSRVWIESGRTLTYLLVFALALVYLTDPSARRMLRYLFMTAALAILATCVWRLWSAAGIAGLFTGHMLSYPISYHNGAAALFLLPFWPLMWLAAGPEEHAPVRGVALGLATGLLGLAVMTQSRGALWSLAISLVFAFVVSPARLRTLFYLLVPALFMVYEFPNLNRYWLEGPGAIGGGLAARTLITASVTAALVGMILALLERWITVGRRMKTVIGTTVLLGALASCIYGLIVLGSVAGGPTEWLSQKWGEFSDRATDESEDVGSSRFSTVSSSGRVDLWTVAWNAFEAAPALGVGADNFVFQYDRHRTIAEQKAQQAHSVELQVLADTGVVGGIFFFGGILLALGGLLWPRCAVGWRRARETWFRSREGADVSRSSEDQTHPCITRWGGEPRVYGWEMALLTGLTYWLIHASIDWHWHMAGVSVPALLMLAAAASSVDARAGAFWPRIERLMSGAHTTQLEQTSSSLSTVPVTSPASVDVVQPEKAEYPLPGPRRTDQLMARARVRSRRAERRQQAAQRLQPSGLLSKVFRTALVALSLAVLVAAGLPYLSLLYQGSAKALARTDGLRAVDRAGVAHWLQPTDPAPFLTQATVYENAAAAVAVSDAAGAAGAVLDNLALGLDRIREAVAHEPASWSLRYRAGVAAMNLLLARGYAAGLDPELDYATLIPQIPGLRDWSALLGSGGTIADPGTAMGSLAANDETRQTAAFYRSFSRAELGQLVLDSMSAARERNPLSNQIAQPTETVRLILEH
ncbi:MAG: O-antigen ligase family protein [Armatimonadetes bacterium]|nr:O-antigen ligase family protein [Armatimonadota bacterium]